MTLRPLPGPHEIARHARPDIYPERFPVPDEKVPWDVAYDDYAPPYFVAPTVLASDRSRDPRGWADPEDISRIAAQLAVRRLCLDPQGRPLNPAGRTGLAGRGLLRCWGPNFAADALFTRTLENSRLAMLTIIRGDTKAPSTPGGFLNARESTRAAALREGGEEALQPEGTLILERLPSVLVYRGYIDDRRNTDHAWIEADMHHWHLSSGIAARLRFRAEGDMDDADSVFWGELSPEGVTLPGGGVRILCRTHWHAVRSALRDFLEDGYAESVIMRDQLASIVGDS